MLPVLLGKDHNYIRFVCIKLGLTMGSISLVVGGRLPSFTCRLPHTVTTWTFWVSPLYGTFSNLYLTLKPRWIGSKPKKIVDPPSRQSPAKNYATLMEWWGGAPLNSKFESWNKWAKRACPPEPRPSRECQTSLRVFTFYWVKKPNNWHCVIL